MSDPLPSCNLPQEPSPVFIVPKPYENGNWIIISQPDWALIGGWIYQAKDFIRAAGPCLRGHGSDAPVPTGKVGSTQENP